MLLGSVAHRGRLQAVLFCDESEMVMGIDTHAMYVL